MAIDRNKVIADAQKHIQKGAFRKAIQEYERIIREAPDDVRVLMKIGDLYVRDGAVREAVRTYTEVADYYVANGFFLKAVAVYKQVLQLNPTSLDPRIRLAELYFQLGLLSDAISQYQLIAQGHQQNGHAQAYLKALDRMVEIDPANVGNRIKLAETQAKAGSTMSAAMQFAAACRLLHQAGRFEEYVKVAERYLHYLPEDGDVSRELARVLLQTGRPLAAIQRLQPFLKKGRFAIDDVLLVADALLQLGEQDRAVDVLFEAADEFAGHGDIATRDTCYRKILEIDPRSEEARRALGDDVQELDDLAFELVAPASEGPDPERDAQIAQLLAEAEIFAKYNLTDRLLDHLQKGLALDPSNEAIRLRRIDALINANRPSDAASELAVLATVLARTNRNAARQRIDEALTLDPTNPDALALRTQLGQSGSYGSAHTSGSHLAARIPTSDVPVLEEIVGDRTASFDELDSLFAAFDSPGTPEEHQGEASLDQDQSFLRHVAELDRHHHEDAGHAHFAAESAPSPVPAELSVSLDRVDAIAAQGHYADAHQALLNLVAEWPEHAELVLQRMDQLPLPSSPSMVVHHETIPGIRPGAALPEATHDSAGDDSLFLDPDDIPEDEPEPVLPFDAGNAAFARPRTTGATPAVVDDYNASTQLTFRGAPVPTSVNDAPSTAPIPRMSMPSNPFKAVDSEVDITANFDEPSALIDLRLSGQHRVARPEIDAHVGRQSSAVTLIFGPTERAMRLDPESDLAAGVRLRRDGNAMAAVELLQAEQFGDFPVAAQFELAAASVELGLYFDALTTLQALFGASDLTPNDIRLVEYQLGLVYEALAQRDEARALFEKLYRQVPGLFPDLAARLARL